MEGGLKMFSLVFGHQDLQQLCEVANKHVGGAMSVHDANLAHKNAYDTVRGSARLLHD